MSKSVWTSRFWKPLVHKNMSNFWNNIFYKSYQDYAWVNELDERKGIEIGEKY